MIVAAAVCPSPPLLIPALTGPSGGAADPLREACATAVRAVLDQQPDLMVVVGPASSTATWPANSHLDLSRFAPQQNSNAQSSLPLSLGIGGMLLDTAGFDGSRLLQSVANDESASTCDNLGTKFGTMSERLGLLVMADGTARRNRKAPGYFDARCEHFDGQIEASLRSGNLQSLKATNQALSLELMATGWPCWQVLAASMGSQIVVSNLTYSDDPFGVYYLVAHLVPSRS